MIRSVNESVRSDDRDRYATYAWPPGEWAADMWACANLVEFGVLVGGTVEAADGWMVPDAGQPGGGEVPDGRIYILTVEGLRLREVHATVIDGQAYFFPSTIC